MLLSVILSVLIFSLGEIIAENLEKKLPKHLKKGKSEVQVPTDTPKMRFASFYPHCFFIFEKARKTAKKEENPRKSRVFRGASFLAPLLGCRGGT